MTRRTTHTPAMKLLDSLGALSVSVSPADQIQQYKNELYQMYNSVTYLLRAQEQFSPILRDQRVLNAPNAAHISQVVQGIVNDSVVIKNKLLAIKENIGQIESVTSPDTYMVHAIGIHQELVNLTQTYGDVVAPQLELLSNLISNVPGADDVIPQEYLNVQQ